MFYNNIDPILLKIGMFEIRYYGLIFVFGFILIYFFLRYLSKKRNLNLSKNDIADFLLYLMIGVVVGARIFYIIFYNLNYYMQNPFDLIAVWKGGLSFHGGLIGAFIFTWLFCRKKNIGFYDLADIVVIPASLALAFGRMGNFLNGELVGRLTDVPWAVKFKGYEGFRHPSQLYESAKNLVMFVVLYNIKDKKLPKGFLFWLFVIMYSFLRFFIEFFRAPDEQLGFILFGLTMGQLLNLAMFFIGLFFIVRLNKGHFVEID